MAAFDRVIRVTRPMPSTPFSVKGDASKTVTLRAGDTNWRNRRPSLAGNHFLAIEALVDGAVDATAVIEGSLDAGAVLTVKGNELVLAKEFAFGQAPRFVSMVDLQFSYLPQPLNSARETIQLIAAAQAWFTDAIGPPSNTSYPPDTPGAAFLGPLTAVGPTAQITYLPTDAADADETPLTGTFYQAVGQHMLNGYTDTPAVFRSPGRQYELTLAMPATVALAQFLRPLQADVAVHEEVTIQAIPGAETALWASLRDYATTETLIGSLDDAQEVTLQTCQWRTRDASLDSILPDQALIDHRGIVWDIVGVDFDPDGEGIIINAERRI
ncbi:MAG: hypothetical protein F4169_20545 [Gammaproteobacteria bacterium]|nr:hypothetical protein [Gammaproteobacteria bacterium]